MNKIKKYINHNIWDYANIIIWLLIMIAEIKDLTNDPNKIVSYLVIFMSIGIITLNVINIIKRIKVKRKYKKSKDKLFGKKRNFWYKLNKFFIIATPAIDDRVDKMLDNKDGIKIIFDMIKVDKEKRKNTKY